MKALAGRKAKVNAVGLIGLVENMPDGNAQRPGYRDVDVGTTIEIHNADAEGRLVLADVMWYAQKRFKPQCMIDLATLTGAIIISLGHEHAGMFSNDDALSEQLTAAGLATEKVWRMPLGKAYDDNNTDGADMKNIGGRCWVDHGGAIPAALRQQSAMGAPRYRRCGMVVQGYQRLCRGAALVCVRLLDEL